MGEKPLVVSTIKKQGGLTMAEKKPTQKELVLKYMRDFGSISTFQAFADLGITRLSGRIYDLKQIGYSFTKERIYTKNRYGKSVYYDKYRLVED